jgi:hypothetical protein
MTVHAAECTMWRLIYVHANLQRVGLGEARLQQELSFEWERRGRLHKAIFRREGWGCDRIQDARKGLCCCRKLVTGEEGVTGYRKLGK